MIEVFEVNDYNELSGICANFDIKVNRACFACALRNDGEIIGVCAFRLLQGGAEIFATKAADYCGIYFDILFRSTLNYLVDKVPQITVLDCGDYYTELGFKPDGNKMTAKSQDIVFPSKCKGH